jgi:Domain of unknown function (DUF4129)
MSLDQAKSLIACLALALLFLLAASARVGAVPLTNYRERVANAAGTLERLQRAYAEEDLSWLQQQFPATIAQVRADLPARETVVSNGERVEVDNAWLGDALGDFEKTDRADQRSAESLARIIERLRALEARLIEVETGKPAATASKDDNKARLAEILRRPEFDQKAEGSSAWQRLWMSFINWLERLLRKLFPTAKPIQPGTAQTLSNIAQVLVIAIAVVVIAFVAWKLLPRYLRNRPKKKAKKSEARIVLGERLEPDQTASDLFAEAETLARSGDLRAAIRKAYIALLCELGDRKLISLAQHKTNRDYLNALRHKTNLYSSMRPLTVSFENHWYGFVPVAENDWNTFRQGYRQAVTTNE